MCAKTTTIIIRHNNIYLIRVKMAIPDKVVGSILLLLSVIIFVYYTLWVFAVVSFNTQTSALNLSTHRHPSPPPTHFLQSAIHRFYRRLVHKLLPRSNICHLHSYYITSYCDSICRYTHSCGDDKRCEEKQKNVRTINSIYFNHITCIPL